MSGNKHVQKKKLSIGKNAKDIRKAWEYSPM